MTVKEESEKVGLKLNIQKMKIMASGPITSCEIDGETGAEFIFWGSKITEEGFLVSSCYSLELCIQMLISFLFSFAFHLSSFHSYL